ncbi:MAG: hypothetical protein CBC48_19055 [bacterium TMED88]|nr:hypothetical protein [Deltaproteobacteria bacterium]OUV23061.1 MAG: hypothetical protein CBC48_19055 [bacterium TMED88]
MQMASIWSNMIAESHAGGLYLAAWSLSACVWFGGSATLAKRQGLSVPRTMAILILIIPLFVLGARAHALLFEAQLPLVRLVEEPSLLFRPGWRLPGGLLLGVLFAPLLARLWRIPFRAFADAVLPFAGLGLATGRIGCFLQGCCHGRVTDLPWGVRFSAGSEAFVNHVGRGLVDSSADYSLPVQPVQLYLILAGLLTSAFLLWLFPRRTFVGEVGLVGVVCVALSSATLELFRESAFVQPVALRSAIPLVVGSVAFLFWVFVRLHKKNPIVPAKQAIEVTSQA